MRYQAVIFDNDDTLVQTISCRWAAIKETALRFHNLTVTDDQIRAVWGHAYPGILAEIMHNAATPEVLQTEYEEVVHKYPKLAHPGAVETVRWLIDGGISVSIVTASGRTIVTNDLDAVGIPLHRLTMLQTAEDTDAHKPDPRVFDPVLKKLAELGIARDKTIYIGDALMDYAAAHDAGMDFCGLTFGLTDAAAFTGAGAAYVRSFAELRTFLS